MQGIIWSLNLSQHSVPALLAYSRHCVSQDRWKSVLVCFFLFFVFLCVCLLLFPLIPTTEGLEQAICLQAIEEQKNC